MAEKPILFNTEMVKAILEGRKTTTRRIIKFPEGMTGWLPDNGFINKEPYLFYPGGIKNPPYAVGDTLWVRETWCRDDITPDDIYYRANYNEREAKELFTDNDLQWKPSIHMPRSAARIFLKVTDVRVERLQNITIDGIEKEGIPLVFPVKKLVDSEHLKKFITLWDSTIDMINHWMDYSWGANPWVWVIEFERIR